MTRTWLTTARAAALAVLLAVAGIGLAAPAQSAPAKPSRLDPAPVLNVHVTPEGFVVPGPNPRPGGPVTFRVTAEGAHGYWWNVYKLLDGATIDQFVTWNAERGSDDPEVARAAMKNLYRYVEWSGGAKVYPGKPLELTQTLTPGTYYFGSLAIPGPQGAPEPAAAAGGGVPAEVAAPTPAGLPAAKAAVEAQEPSVFGWLDITEEYRPARLPRVDGLVYMTEAGGRDVMIAPRRLPAQGRVWVINHSRQPQETVFMDLRDGATHRDVRAYFDAQLDGRPLPPRPFGDSIGGMLALSPDKQIIMGYEMPADTYGLFSWLRDSDTLLDAAATGMTSVIDLR